jgi:hypothetical protein
MKNASTALQEHMAGDITTLAYLWEIKQNAGCCGPNAASVPVETSSPETSPETS